MTFDRDHAFLSNFYPSPIEHEGYWYDTVEHLFQASKTVTFTDHHVVRLATSPGKAKRLGRSLPLRDDWENVKADVMRIGLQLKFAPGGDMAARLLATGDRELVEGNTWGDEVWGKTFRNVDGLLGWHGENLLGRLLMERRDQLRFGSTD